MSRAFDKIPLTLLLAVGFALLGTVPLVSLLALNHNRLEAANLASLQRQLATVDGRAMETVSALQDRALHVMPTVAATVAADLELFKGEAADEVLYAAIHSVDTIDALYVSFEDGTHRVVTRVDRDRRQTDARIPSEARWHSSWIDPFSVGAARARHRTFYAEWGSPLDTRWDEPSDFDPETLDHYQRAKRTGTPAMVEPSINPDTGTPVVSIAVPILVDGKFVGIVGANLTFRHLSAHLARHQVSPSGLTVVLDADGHIIAHPSTVTAYRAAADGQAWPPRAILGSPELEDAAMEVVQARASSDDGEGAAVVREFDGKRYHLLATPFRPVGSEPWMVLTVVPESDFVGETREALRWLGGVIAGVTVVQLLLIGLFARRVGSRIEAMARRFRSIRRLRFDEQAHMPARTTRVRELSELESGFQLLLRSVQGFARFVPRGVVAHLITRNEQPRPAVEQRELALFFCDLQGFTAVAEHADPNTLLRQVSEYFDAVTSSITDEGGTIDKFIGDAVMAFWGAPETCDAPALRAARAALRVRHRFAALTRRWEAEGLPPLRVRIGLHIAPVLVGTIGTDARLSYTALGDGVNVAARLEGANKVLGTAICASDAIRQAASGLVCRPLRRLTVKGRDQPLLVHELLGAVDSTDPELAAPPGAAEQVRVGQAVVDALAHHDWATARRLVETHLQSDPEDAAAQALHHWLQSDEQGSARPG